MTREEKEQGKEQQQNKKSCKVKTAAIATANQSEAL